jgi:hypothetical protein
VPISPKAATICVVPMSRNSHAAIVVAVTVAATGLKSARAPPVTAKIPAANRRNQCFIL